MSMLAHPSSQGIPRSVDGKVHPYVTDWLAGAYPGDSDRPGVARWDAIRDAQKRRDADPLPQFDDAVHEIMADLAALLISKQADYGPDAINRAPGGSLNGINVRMHDKLSRVINLTAPQRDGGNRYVVANHESLRDTYRDLANYAVIATMVLDGTWPE